MTKEERANHMADCCEQAGCNDKAREKHCRLFVNNHWHCHPSPLFCSWFKELHESTGVNAFTAWNTQFYRQQFLEAKSHGWDADFEKPKREPQSLDAEKSRRQHKINELRKLISRIGRSVPAPLPTDYDQGSIGAPSYQKR